MMFDSASSCCKQEHQTTAGRNGGGASTMRLRSELDEFAGSTGGTGLNTWDATNFGFIENLVGTSGSCPRSQPLSLSDWIDAAAIAGTDNDAGGLDSSSNLAVDQNSGNGGVQPPSSHCAAVPGMPSWYASCQDATTESGGSTQPPPTSFPTPDTPGSQQDPIFMSTQQFTAGGRSRLGVNQGGLSDFAGADFAGANFADSSAVGGGLALKGEYHQRSTNIEPRLSSSSSSSSASSGSSAKTSSNASSAHLGSLSPRITTPGGTAEFGGRGGGRRLTQSRRGSMIRAGRAGRVGGGNSRRSFDGGSLKEDRCSGPVLKGELSGGGQIGGGGEHSSGGGALLGASSAGGAASSNHLAKFTLRDESGKRRIRSDVIKCVQDLPPLAGLYFDRRQKGFRVRYQNVYVGWIALSRFNTIEEAYIAAREIWENAKAQVEKHRNPVAAVIASLPLQAEAKAAGKNRGGRPRTVTQLPSCATTDFFNAGNPQDPGAGAAGGPAYGPQGQYPALAAAHHHHHQQSGAGGSMLLSDPNLVDYGGGAAASVTPELNGGGGQALDMGGGQPPAVAHNQQSSAAAAAAAISPINALNAGLGGGAFSNNASCTPPTAATVADSASWQQTPPAFLHPYSSLLEVAVSPLGEDAELLFTNDEDNHPVEDDIWNTLDRKEHPEFYPGISVCDETFDAGLGHHHNPERQDGSGAAGSDAYATFLANPGMLV